MNKLPHEGVRTRLKPSKIHGIGVFAILPIRKGAEVFAEDNAPIVWVDAQIVNQLSRAIRDIYEDFAIVKGARYGVPKHLDTLSTSWYLNHSGTPNVAADRNFRFRALRNIRSGEELTVDYRTYSDNPKGAKPKRVTKNRS